MEENGFIMQDTTKAGTQTPQYQAGQNQTEQNQTESMQNGQQEYVRWGEQSQQGTQAQPQPMPTENNTYRFQNSEAVERASKSRTEKSDRLLPMSKVIVSAVIFGVVAAICFFAVNMGINKWKGETTIDRVNSSGTKVPVVTVSGGAVGVSDVSGIVEQVMPSIVAITEKSTQTSFFGQTYSSEGAGSGFIVKQDNDQLLIVTNNHVVADADKISVQFNDGESVDATVKGTSESNDLAVLIVKLKDLKDSTKKSIKVASLGSSDDARVGQMVIAIGNALGYGQSVTVGYLSAKDREVTSSDSSGTGSGTTQILLQTDAAINPGNSGGALIDTSGNVIGINSSKYFAYGDTTVEGMGYAIPMSDAVSVINDLMDRTVLKDEEKGYLGITGRTIDETVSKTYGIPVGVYVASLSDTGAAFKAGIKQGDVITAIDDRSVKTISEVQEIVNNTKVGTEITVTVKRSNDGEYKEKKIKVTLKSKDTLDGLEEESDGQGSENRSQGDYYQGNDYGQGDGSEVFPWKNTY